MNGGKKRYGLTIGCSYAQNPNKDRLELNGTINDAMNMKRFLTNRGYDVILMCDDLSVPTSSRLFPSESNIREQIKDILKRANSGDDVAIYYAGHGVQTVSDNRTYTGEDAGIINDVELDGKDEAIVPADIRFPQLDNLIVDDVFNNYLRLYGKVGVNVFIMTDCCHSGTMCDLKYSYKCNNNSTKTNNNKSATISYDEIPDTNRDKTSPIRANVITLSGCADDETSKEDVINIRNGITDAGQKQGVLTGYFMYVINTEPSVTSDIFKILEGLMSYTSQYNQNPKISSNLPLHTNKAYRAILDAASNVNTTTNNVTGLPIQPIPIPTVPPNVQPVQPPKITSGSSNIASGSTVPKPTVHYPVKSNPGKTYPINKYVYSAQPVSTYSYNKNPYNTYYVSQAHMSKFFV